MAVEMRLPRYVWRVTTRRKRSGGRDTRNYFSETLARQEYAREKAHESDSTHPWHGGNEPGSTKLFFGEILWTEVME